MKHQRPQSYDVAGHTVRRDATNNIWRVFDRDGREVYATAGTNGDSAQDRALNFALNLSQSQEHV